MAQRLGAHAAFAQDQFPASTRQHITVTPVPGDPAPSTGPLIHCMWHTDIHVGKTPIYIIFLKMSLKQKIKQKTTIRDLNLAVRQWGWESWRFSICGFKGGGHERFTNRLNFEVCFFLCTQFIYIGGSEKSGLMALFFSHCLLEVFVLIT